MLNGFSPDSGVVTREIKVTFHWIKRFKKNFLIKQDEECGKWKSYQRHSQPGSMSCSILRVWPWPTHPIPHVQNHDPIRDTFFCVWVTLVIGRKMVLQKVKSFFSPFHRLIFSFIYFFEWYWGKSDLLARALIPMPPERWADRRPMDVTSASDRRRITFSRRGLFFHREGNKLF